MMKRLLLPLLLLLAPLALADAPAWKSVGKMKSFRVRGTSGGFSSPRGVAIFEADPSPMCDAQLTHYSYVFNLTESYEYTVLLQAFINGFEIQIVADDCEDFDDEKTVEIDLFRIMKP